MYLAVEFGNRLDDARQAMNELAAAHDPADRHRRGSRLYEAFRPLIPIPQASLARALGVSCNPAGCERLAPADHRMASRPYQHIEI